MLHKIISYSVKNKLIVFLFVASLAGIGIYSAMNIPIGAVPDITNNQVQVITTSRNLATEDVERYLTYPVELEMANLPGVQEIRSVSKFGLSVVTVVFDDDMGSYLPRQLIAEKIKAAEERIPASFGKPFMGPVTTGLGEIYQYVLEVDSLYQAHYSLQDLRTIQDWIVKRNLAGIPGVVEVNTWGGKLKQYEVEVDPNRLRELNIDVKQVYQALSQSNSVEGGGYIEKSDQAFFIRGEGRLKTIEDIEQVVVKSFGNRPVLIKDIGRVVHGSTTRFGAITGNGTGEKVMGQVMMLKGANSSEVINAVKQRVADISPTLPAGISINPVLERSELVAKTTFTISENLLLGCLIVVFIVVLLLGSVRSGLIVASVIPLALLFALSMMYIFHIDANLMSLGAVDFGIIIDGAVIIVEFIGYQISVRSSEFSGLSRSQRLKLKESIASSGAGKMMHSAIFGQFVILIVFIPILSLVGVEGKMFRPMALVFSFALIGAIILCLTYVPMISSLFIKPGNSGKLKISAVFMEKLQMLYQPVLKWSLANGKRVLATAVVLLVFGGFMFSRMGAEFVPTLDEGDFVIQPVLKTGTTLTNTVELTTKMEKILKAFPEVHQVVTRIGAAEVPTDPMSMEESDVIIKLKPKKYWQTAQTKDQLAEAFKESLSVIPGIDYEFTQPIEMRFNELITGVRADLAIKVFGEDLTILADKAQEIEELISDVEGASDVTVEKTVGLPQLSVEYNRDKMAQYGVTADDLSSIISMGFAGKSCGVIFEGEKQFDLVVRFPEEYRNEIANLSNAPVTTSSGAVLPLHSFANIQQKLGPAKISRDDTKRRIVVGVNVRERDLQSVVNDVRNLIEKEVQLPTGYTITYGGQFENLQRARTRLLYAIPVALMLIFVLLYFAFSSIRDALIIYAAIPLSTVGGISFLYLRSMPFSISAGIGFIALFGIAVLNGIVLIEEFKSRKEKETEANISDVVFGAAISRLRPVLLTASAAALGFLPMAISSSAGAEVQRPLATVVIGGLVSATLLTLLVVPVLYATLEKRRLRRAKMPNVVKVLMVGLMMGVAIQSNAQSTIDNEEALLKRALTNHSTLIIDSLETEYYRKQVAAAVSIPGTKLFYGKDQNNIAPNDLPLSVLGVSQIMDWPGCYIARRKVAESKVETGLAKQSVSTRAIAAQVKLALNDVLYHEESLLVYEEMDSMMKKYYEVALAQYKQGQVSGLVEIAAKSKHASARVQVKKANSNVVQSYAMLATAMADSGKVVIANIAFEKRTLRMSGESPPTIELAHQNVNTRLLEVNASKKQMYPQLEVTYFHGRNNGMAPQAYPGFEAGVVIPLWSRAGKQNVRAAEDKVEMAKHTLEQYSTELALRKAKLLVSLNALQAQLSYFEQEGLALTKRLKSMARVAYDQGEIDYMEYARLEEQAYQLRLGYLEALHQYNSTVINLNYLQ